MIHSLGVASIGYTRNPMRAARIAFAALLLGRLITGLLFHVNTTDPLTFAGMSLVLVLIAAVACLVPARRAATVDPLVALRAY